MDTALNLARTKTAIAEYDSAFRALHAAECGEDLDSLIVRVCKAEAAVGEAFALDTAHINRPSDARRILPCPWLRALADKYGS